jgi:hypothetical protein
MDGKPRLVLLHGSDADAEARGEAIDRIEQLIAQGKSRLTAQRIVEIERGTTEPSRARRHPLSRQ